MRSRRIGILCNDYSPRDLGPGPTTLAFERLEKQGLAHDASRGDAVRIIQVSMTASECEEAGEIGTTNSDGTNVPPWQT